MIDAFLSQNCFYFEILSASALFLTVFQRRRNFFLRAVLCITMGLLISQFLPINPFADITIENNELYLFLVNFYPRYLILFFVCFFIVWICIDCFNWEALFISASAYCIQHIYYKVYNFLQEELSLYVPTFAGSLLFYFLRLLFMLACYFAFYVFFVKKLKQLSGFKINNRYMIVICVLIITSANSFNGLLYSIYLSYAKEAFQLIYLLYVYTFMPILLCLICLIGLLDGTYRQTLNSEYLMIQSLYENMNLQYEANKENADLINVKYHDLKHFLENSNYTKEALQDIQNAVEQYEMIPKTDKKALNVVLMEKIPIMTKENILFRSNLNGTLLEFISEIDVYSYFRNLLDNAIAHLRTELPSERKLYLEISRAENMVKIVQENTLTTPIKINKSTGLPETIKSDKENHGFGTKSMKQTIEKYNGQFVIYTKDNKFTCISLIPIPEENLVK